MKISAKGVAFIGGNEGFSSRWYLDPVGVPTIGYGFTWMSKVFREWWMAKHGRKMKRGDTISKADSDAVLRIVIDREYGPPVNAKFAGQPGHILDAGKSMTFNAGYGSLKWKWATAIAAGRLKEGAARWRNTATTARGRRLPGLVRRRKEEADIAEFKTWPAWLAFGGKSNKIPARNVYVEDVAQAQKWLKALGFNPGKVDGFNGKRTHAATLLFQQQHENLANDGLIGQATLAALQRAIDLKAKAATRAGGGVVATGAGAADKANEVSGYGDLIMWGGFVFIVAALAFLAWRYRDELKISIKSIV